MHAHRARLPLLAILPFALAACRADFTADIRNHTPQPLFVKIFEERQNSEVILTSARLGPGDRAQIGPVRAEIGRPRLAIDSRPNPQAPVIFNLRPGTSYFNVSQQGDLTAGPLEVREVIP